MDALKGLGKSLTWSLTINYSFRSAKDLLATVPELVHPCPGAQISLAVDASESHVGSVLQQLLDGSWPPWLSSPRSCLKLSGSPPLSTENCLFRVSPPWSALQQCHLAFLAEFTSSVVHVPGIENILSDALSRPSPEPEPAPRPVSAPTASSLVSPSLPSLPLSFSALPL